MTITPAYMLEVSRRIKEEFENGKEYYALHGSRVRLPHRADQTPLKENLEWHNGNVFKN